MVLICGGLCGERHLQREIRGDAIHLVRGSMVAIQKPNPGSRHNLNPNPNPGSRHNLNPNLRGDLTIGHDPTPNPDLNPNLRGDLDPNTY